MSRLRVVMGVALFLAYIFIQVMDALSGTREKLDLYDFLTGTIVMTFVLLLVFPDLFNKLEGLLKTILHRKS